jgi:hypothetical protein
MCVASLAAFTGGDRVLALALDVATKVSAVAHGVDRCVRT